MSIKLRSIECAAANDGVPRALSADDAPGPAEPRYGRDFGGRAMTTYHHMAERQRQLDHYRQAVERHLGAALAHTRDGDCEGFLAHVERCFDWGVSAPACSRTWVVKVTDQTSRCSSQPKQSPRTRIPRGPWVPHG
jgi:hypothetical protein